MLSSLFHPDHSTVVTPRDVNGRFSSWLLNKVFAHVDEVYCPEKREFVETLKPLITGEDFECEEKFLLSRKERNTANFMLTSNHENGMVIDRQERRFFMLVIEDDAPVCRWSRQQWAETRKWLEGHKHILLQWFLGRNISGFNAKGHAPRTEAFERVTKEGTNAADRTLTRMWDEELWPFSKDICTAGEVVDTARKINRVELRERAVAHFLKRHGGVWLKKGRRPVLVSEHNVLDITVPNAPAWIIRNHQRWLDASETEIRAEMIRRSGWDYAGSNRETNRTTEQMNAIGLINNRK